MHWRTSGGHSPRGEGTPWRSEPTRSSADGAELPLQVVDLVPQPRRVLEAEVDGGLVHLLLEREDEALELAGAEVLDLALALGVVGGPPPTTVAAGDRRALLGPTDEAEDVGDGLADRLRVDPVL